MKKKVTYALAAVALLGAIGYSTTIAVVRADTTSNHPMIQALAERFGLNEDEVEEALDEIRADHFAKMQQAHEDRLNQAVEDGVITEDQKSALMEKHEEMAQEREQNRDEMRTWFEEQGIDEEALHEYMGGFGRHGKFSGMGKMGMH